MTSKHEQALPLNYGQTGIWEGRYISNHFSYVGFGDNSFCSLTNVFCGRFSMHRQSFKKSMSKSLKMQAHPKPEAVAELCASTLHWPNETLPSTPLLVRSTMARTHLLAPRLWSMAGTLKRRPSVNPSPSLVWDVRRPPSAVAPRAARSTVHPGTRGGGRGGG